MSKEPIEELLREGVDAAQEVVDNWSSGDLARAVNRLEEWMHRAAVEMKI